MILSLLEETAQVPLWSQILSLLGGTVILLLSIGNNKLKKILAETKPNGGATLKDQLTKIQSSITNLALWVEAGHHLSERPMLRADSSGNFVWVNSAFLSLTGRSSEEVENLGWLSAVHHDDRDRVSREWHSAVDDQRVFQAQFRVVNGYTKEEKEVNARAFPVSTLGYFGSWLVLEEI